MVARAFRELITDSRAPVTDDIKVAAAGTLTYNAKRAVAADCASGAVVFLWRATQRRRGARS
jgi:hypothetical protein